MGHHYFHFLPFPPPYFFLSLPHFLPHHLLPPLLAPPYYHHSLLHFSSTRSLLFPSPPHRASLFALSPDLPSRGQVLVDNPSPPPYHHPPPPSSPHHHEYIHILDCFAPS